MSRIYCVKIHVSDSSTTIWTMQMLQQVLLLLHHKIAESDRFKVVDWFLSEKYGLPVITKFGDCCSFSILMEKKRNVKKISCYICSSTEEDNWGFFKDLDFYKYSYIKKELGNMVSSVFKENAWIKAHCSWMLKKAGSSKALLNDCQE